MLSDIKLLIYIILVILVILAILFLLYDDTKAGSTHFITLSSEYILNESGSTVGLAYKMKEHLIEDDTTGNISNVTLTRYGNNTQASIPGPIIKVNQYDTVKLQIQNNLGKGCVSVHVHGFSFDIDNDGTLKTSNGIKNECARTDSVQYLSEK